jgi:hypothetical protein
MHNGTDCEANARSIWRAVVQTRVLTCRLVEWMRTAIVLKLPIWASAGKETYVRAVGLSQSPNQLLRRTEKKNSAPPDLHQE